MPSRPPATIAVAAAAYRARHLLNSATFARLGVCGRSKAAPTAADLNLDNIRAAARAVGVEVESLPGNFLKLSHAGAISYAHGSDFAFESVVSYFLCGDKPLTARLLAERNLPVPMSRSFELSQYEEARRFFGKLSKPVVIKPSRGTAGGSGITLDVRNDSQLRDAFARAGAFGNDVLVEQQVDGEHLRITILDGEILGAVRRIPARVVGDGASSIRALIGAKNQLWRTRSPQNVLFRPIMVDLEVRRLLRREGLRMSSVPADGEEILLRRVSNADAGGEIADIGDELHDDVRRLALRAAEAVGPVLCGVDLIVRDITKPVVDSESVYINEVNTTPSLYVANAMVEGHASTCASERILRYLFKLPPISGENS